MKAFAEASRDSGESTTGVRRTQAKSVQIQGVDAMKRFSRAVSMIVGVGFSALLIALYLPATLILQVRATALANNVLPTGTDSERRDLLSRHGFGADYVQNLVTFGSSCCASGHHPADRCHRLFWEAAFVRQRDKGDSTVGPDAAMPAWRALAGCIAEGQSRQLDLDVTVIGGSAGRIAWGDWGEAVMLSWPTSTRVLASA